MALCVAEIARIRNVVPRQSMYYYCSKYDDTLRSPSLGLIEYFSSLAYDTGAHIINTYT